MVGIAREKAGEIAAVGDLLEDATSEVARSFLSTGICRG
jgi:hypothetical protein